MSFTYRCAEFPGMDGCPGAFTAATADEVYALCEVHGRIAHGEDPNAWSDDERRMVRELIKPD